MMKRPSIEEWYEKKEWEKGETKEERPKSEHQTREEKNTTEKNSSNMSHRFFIAHKIDKWYQPLDI